MADVLKGSEGSEPNKGESRRATPREFTAEQQMIADFGATVHEAYAAFRQDLKTRVEAIPNPEVKVQMERRVDALVTENLESLTQMDKKLRTDARKYGPKKELSLADKHESIQRQGELLATRAKAVLKRLGTNEAVFKGGEHYLIIQLETCRRQEGDIKKLLKAMKDNQRSATKAMQAQDAKVLSTHIAALEKIYPRLDKMVQDLSKTLDEFLSPTQDSANLLVEQKSQELDGKIRTLILEITQLKEEFGNIGERVAKQPTMRRSDLLHDLKVKVQELEERIPPLEELTAYSSDDVKTHDIADLEEANKNRSAFLEETQTLFEEAMRTYNSLAESFKLSEEASTKDESKESKATTQTRDKKGGWLDGIKKWLQ